MSEVSKAIKVLEKLVSEGEEPHKIRTAAERVLGLQPNNLLGLQCKSVSHMLQDKYGAAMQVLGDIEKHHKEAALKPEFLFHKAYCYYRLNQYGEAKSVLNKVTTPNASSLHLLAQIHYNEENYVKAAEIYEQLLQKGNYRDEQEKAELLTNYSAALSMTGNLDKVNRVVREADSKNSDLLYNCATAQIESNVSTQEKQADKEAMKGALKTLQQAESLVARQHGSSSVKTIDAALALSEEERQNYFGGSLQNLELPKTPERKFFNEAATIWAQMAYVYHHLQQEDKCKAILDLILGNRPSSGTVTAICSINRTALVADPQKELFESLKRLKVAQNPKYINRLTSRQIMCIHYNTALLCIKVGNLNSARREVERMEKVYPNNLLTHTLRLALVISEGRKKQADSSFVKNCLDKFKQDTSKSGVNQNVSYGQLVAAQVFLELNDLPSAITALSGIAEVQSKPSVTSTLFAWQIQVGEEAKATALLEAYVQQNMSTSPENVKSVLIWSVEYLLRTRKYALATSYLQKLTESNRKLAGDDVFTALLALCLSYTNLAEARQIVVKLQSASGVVGAKVSSSTVEDLEKQMPSRHALEELGYKRETLIDEKKKGKTGATSRRRAMRRPPKNRDARLDPERWLPMAVRSYIKDLPPKRKKELKRIRANEQEQKRRQAAQRKKEGIEKKSETF